MEDLVMSQVYCCFKCRRPVCYHNDIVDKNYVYGKHKAFLFSQAMNIAIGCKEKALLLTGTYLTADVYCSDCGEKLGWKYFESYQSRYKFKEGKIAIIRFKIDNDHSWH